MDCRELLIRFAEGRETPQEREFIKNSIAKLIRQRGKDEIFRRNWGDDYLEDILSELRERLILYKRAIEEKNFINWQYFLNIVRSCVDKFYSRIRPFEEISYDALKKRTEQDDRSIEETNIFAYEERVEEKVEGSKFYEVMIKILDEKDYPVVCYYLCKEVQKDCNKPKGISEANLYKRWERFKKKLKDHLPYEPSADAVKYFIDRFLSEICQKQGYI
jgi:DNA-directed RNA polymerase specialized sigma subunit